ncbi:MAG: hypothetical protein MUP71_12360, partial [Candidatus Aminicenantes bacterium]|nr:hypothetical protein [Candidatus Aminicenantes bacterium]
MMDAPPAFSDCPPGALPDRDIMVQSMKKDALELKAEETASFWELLAAQEKKLFNFLHKALNFSEDSS